MTRAISFVPDEIKPITIKSDIVPSPQQLTVLDWVQRGKGNAFVEAVAGGAKTTTLLMACGVAQGSIAFTAFNRKIVDDIKSKLIRSNSLGNVRVGTFHSFGFGAWKRQAPDCRVEEYDKARRMHDAIETPWNLRGAVERLVSIGKQSMVGVLWTPDNRSIWENAIQHYDVLIKVDREIGRSEEDTIDDLVHYAEAGVLWSADKGEEIVDYDDMLWLPILKNVPVYQYDWVFIDECQDTNAARRLLARRMMKQNGRAIFVGDKNQSIYGFTGADSDAVDIIIDEFKCSRLPLTCTYRCSKKATELAREWVPEIEAHENNLEGSIDYSTPRNLTRVGDDGQPLFRLEPGKDAILCRITKPLVELAFQLIGQGIPCHVEGRDIGKSLDRLASKWKVNTVVELLQELEQYRRNETDKLIARDAKFQVESLNDRIDTLIVITEGCTTVSEVRNKINRIFKDTDTGDRAETVVLSTIHKAKSREWDRVIILGWGAYMPSRWARREWEIRQERNLMYVSVTRTKDKLVLMTGLEES